MNNMDTGTGSSRKRHRLHGKSQSRSMRVCW